MVRRLAKEGYAVVVHANTSIKQATALADETGSHVVTGDLLTEQGPQQVFSEALDEAGRIDHLINNASTFPRDTIHTSTRETWMEMNLLHVRVPHELTLLAHDQGARSVVNLLDTRIRSRDPDHFSYMMSKRALFDLTRTMAIELAPTRVNGVAPGAIMQATDGGSLTAAIEATILKRQGDPEDVADAVAYLVRAQNTTGDVIFVDGGRHLRT